MQRNDLFENDPSMMREESKFTSLGNIGYQQRRSRLGGIKEGSVQGSVMSSGVGNKSVAGSA